MAHIYVQITTDDLSMIYWETDFEVPEKSVDSLKDLFERMEEFLGDQKEGESHE